ncbi:lipoyl(octanoyl) transferase LipB [Pleionea sediminis]|uniref:lipoyl(octanoyl) transferase LipB n=1 Tax=Pleionea sediminis TaxID=2569479 RepID=UPI0011857542|nr:lipoyl(octanoyl) transferase LipB [Pleionea sediminis]
MSNLVESLVVRQLGRQSYEPVWRTMSDFTDNRNQETADEIWLVEHDPVFTQGQAGKAEHILAPGDIPVIKVDRGGQVTYHGPGQQVAYFLIDLRRKKLGVRDLVSSIEEGIIDVLDEYGIGADARPDAPGVYVESGAKICSLGLRIRRGCSFHGLALNINLDLEPFSRINPCGYQGMKVTQLSDEGGPDCLSKVEPDLLKHLMANLGYNSAKFEEGLPELEGVV